MPHRFGFLILLVVLPLVTPSQGQAAERMVLCELFTSTTCPPCASANPYFDGWLFSYAQRGRVAVVKYHVWWPAPGNDPYYLANIAENSSRNSYYGNNYVPHLYVDGTIDAGGGYGSWPGTIDGRMSNVSPFVVSIDGYVTTSGGPICVKVKSDGSALGPGPFILQVAVVESGLHYTGPNGDPVHNYVMRDMLPDPSGEQFSLSLNDSLLFMRNVPWNTGWLVSNCEIFAWVQEKSSKSVLQAGRRPVSQLIFPPPPQLLLPANHATEQQLSPALRWRGALSATAYRLRIGNDASFASVVLDDSTFADTFFTPGPFAYLKTYYWQVVARNSSGWGTSSFVWDFSTTYAPPLPPVLLSPVNGADSCVIRPLLEWSTPLTALSYYLQVATDSLFGSIAYEDSLLAEARSLVHMLHGGTTYCWRVRGKNAKGTGDWSDVSHFTTGPTAVCEVGLHDRWNIVSVPLRLGSEMYQYLFPHAISRPFLFTPGSGYSGADTISFGYGFWMKFDGVQRVGLEGSFVTSDTFRLSKGWNLIGSISSGVAVNTLSSDPPGIINGLVYGYRGGYIPADTIRPGEGYWIKTSDSGSVTLSAAASRKISIPQERPEAILEAYNRITISDAAGSVQQLYVSGGRIGSSSFDIVSLPPPPPAGAFDARFSGDRRAISLDGGPATITIATSHYPVTLHWDIANTRDPLNLDIDGQDIELKGKGVVRLTYPAARITVRQAGRAENPAAYRLGQNYPNPFNPSTSIIYTLAAPGRVTLIVYDIAGRVVAILVNEGQTAGEHTVEWNAQGMPSGTYFYRLGTGGYTDTKEMILMK